MAMNRLKGFGNAWVILSLSLLVLTSCVSEVKRYSQDSKVAVVLGAGASKGFAHVGVLKILEANQIPIHMIVGTSAGSFVGSLYAYGYDAFELQKMSFEMVKGDVVDMMIIPDRGFIKGKKLENFINEKVQNTPVERLKIPFYPVATDIQNGEEIVFISGNTGRAVRASCSVPGVFRPVTINNRMYVDGGVVSPVAVNTARRFGADVVIAVDISSNVESSKPTGIIETLIQSINIMYNNLATTQLSGADIVIRPDVSAIAPDDFSKRHDAILAGERAAMQALPEIMKIINQLKAEGRLEPRGRAEVSQRQKNVM